MEEIRARGQEWNKSTLLASLWKKKTNQKEEKQQTARTKLLQSGCCLSKVHRWLFVSRTNAECLEVREETKDLLQRAEESELIEE